MSGRCVVTRGGGGVREGYKFVALGEMHSPWLVASGFLGLDVAVGRCGGSAGGRGGVREGYKVVALGGMHSPWLVASGLWRLMAARAWGRDGEKGMMRATR